MNKKVVFITVIFVIVTVLAATNVVANAISKIITPLLIWRDGLPYKTEVGWAIRFVLMFVSIWAFEFLEGRFESKVWERALKKHDSRDEKAAFRMMEWAARMETFLLVVVIQLHLYLGRHPNVPGYAFPIVTLLSMFLYFTVRWASFGRTTTAVILLITFSNFARPNLIYLIYILGLSIISLHFGLSPIWLYFVIAAALGARLYELIMIGGRG